VDCVCCGSAGKLQPIDDGCSLDRVPIIHDDEHKRLLVRVAIPAEGFQPTVHHDCTHNQVQAIRNRVIGVVPKPNSEGLSLMRKGMHAITRSLVPTTEDDIFALSKRHGGAKGARYARAAEEYLSFGLQKSDSNIKTFVKPERFDPTSKENPDPRAIQFRAPKYCVALAKYLRPIEEQVYQFQNASNGVPRSRNVAKGLNSKARAHALMEKAKHFKNPCFITMDASRFDKHVSVAHLRMEHNIYLTCNSCPEFARLLNMQLLNKCFTTRGIKYTVKGRRMSGDMNTAIGNIIIMLIMIFAYCSYHLGLSKWDCLDDGDDFVIIIEREDEIRFCADVSDVFLTMGMEMKVDPPVYDLHDVEFCQSKIIEYCPGGYKFVRNYRKVISNSTSGVRNWGNRTVRNNTINSVGMCELVLNLGIPVLQEYALALLRNTSGSKDPMKYASMGYKAHMSRELANLRVSNIKHVRPTSITSEARASFARAYGMSEGDQIDLEERLRAWSFVLDDPIYHGAEWDVDTWTGTMSYNEIYRLGKSS